MQKDIAAQVYDSYRNKALAFLFLGATVEVAVPVTVFDGLSQFGFEIFDLCGLCVLGGWKFSPNQKKLIAER